ncbi:MAG: SRPBCC family protein [Myxococcota bacterium]|nr:SRPBCC family protein [Myxococcota bacterium]
MREYILERHQFVPGDLSTIFEFFENPHNLSKITPPWLNFRVDSASDEEVRIGTEISYKIKWFGLSLRWKSRITEYESNARFADKMILGPYKSWYHVHQFRSVPGGVEIVDTVKYRLPFGPVGRLAHFLIVSKQLKSIFDYRKQTIERLF